MLSTENINIFDVLTFIQMRTVLVDKTFTSGNDYTHKIVSECDKKKCATIDKQ